MKKKAVFALSQLPKDDGVPKLIEVAKTQRNPEVRKQAFFWLGQSHDPRALDYIESVLKQHELVTNAVVLTDRDHLSDTLHAFVTAAQRLETQALQRHCAGRLSRQVVPSYFHQVDELPVSQNGKVDRRAVWEQYLASRAERA